MVPHRTEPLKKLSRKAGKVYSGGISRLHVLFNFLEIHRKLRDCGTQTNLSFYTFDDRSDYVY